MVTWNQTRVQKSYLLDHDQYSLLIAKLRGVLFIARSTLCDVKQYNM